MLANNSIYTYLYIFSLLAVVIEVMGVSCRLRIFFTSLIMFLIFGMISLRWEVGTDWDTYFDLYNIVDINSSLFDIYHFDLGYVLLNIFSKYIYNDYSFYLIVNTVLSSCLIFFILLKYGNYPAIGLFIFLTNYIPIHFIGSNRRSIAISCILLLYIFSFYNKKIIYRLSIYLFAFFQHKTVIVVAPILLLNRLFNRLNLNIWFVFCAIFVSIGFGYFGFHGLLMSAISSLSHINPNFSILTTISDYSEGIYLDQTPDAIDPFFQSFLSICKRMIMLSIFFYGVKKNRDLLSIYLLKIYIFGVILYCLFIGAPLLQVLSIYFLIVEILIISRVWSYFSKNEKIFIFPYIAINGTLSYNSSLSIYPELFFPYKSILF